MKKNFLILLLLLCFSVKSNPVNLNVYLNFNECINCFISLNFVKQINSTVGVAFFIERKDSSVAEEFLEQYDLDKRIKFVYTTKVNLLSTCKLFLADSLIEEFPLKELPDKLAKINLEVAKAFNTTTRSIKLPKKLNIKNDRAEIIISKNILNIYDYILNKNITLKIHNDSAQIIKEINGKDFKAELFLQIKSDIDTALYRKCRKLLVSLNKHTPHIERAYTTDSSLYLLINFPAVEFEKKDTAITMKFFQYEYNYITHQKNLSFIYDDAFSSANKNEIFLNNAMPFYHHNNASVFPLFYTTAKKQYFVLSEWKNKTKTQTRFNNRYNFKLSGLEWKSAEIDSNLAIINERFYFFSLHGIMYDYTRDKLYKLNNSIFSRNTFIADVCEKENKFKLIAYINEKPVLITYDPTTNLINSSMPLDFPNDYSENTVKFYDANTVFSINKDNTLIYLTTIK